MNRWARKTYSGWGRISHARSLVARPEIQDDIPVVLDDLEGDTIVARGCGRSYGDAALNDRGRIALTSRLNHFVSLDRETGSVVCQAGVTIIDLIQTLLKSGYLPPVCPGTGFVTMGGAVANDVHGKNHHRDGSFGDHLEWIKLRLANGEIRTVSPKSDVELFRATVGGIGLTGIIEQIAFKLERVPGPWLEVRKRRIQNLPAFLDAFEEEARSKYVVGWIDALATGKNLGRGALEVANPTNKTGTKKRRRERRIPFDLPGFALNRATVKTFNEIYFRSTPGREATTLEDYETFLFPLDRILDWNRMYGKKGFYQFQCVLPKNDGKKSLEKLLSTISAYRKASFLAVLKAMGAAGKGFLSFPMKGYSLALDFPNGKDTLELLRKLEAITLDQGGRVYLAKDSVLSAESLAKMYPDLDKYKDILNRVDPERVFQSDMSRRLDLK